MLRTKDKSATWQEQQRDLQEENENLKMQVASLKTLLRENMRSSASKTTTTGGDDPAVKALQDRLEKMKKEHEEDLDRLLTRIKSKDKNIDEMKAKIEKTTTASPTGAEEKAKRLEKELQDMRASALKMSDERESVDSQLQDALKHSEQLEMKLKSSNGRRLEAQGRVAALEGELAEARSRVEATDEKARSADKKMRKMAEELSEIRSECEKLRTDVKHALEQKAACAKEANELRSELKTERDALESARDAEKTVTAHLAIAKEKCERLEKDVEETYRVKSKRSMQLVKDLRSQLSKLHSKYAKLEAAYNSVKKRAGASATHRKGASGIASQRESPSRRRTSGVTVADLLSRSSTRKNVSNSSASPKKPKRIPVVRATRAPASAVSKDVDGVQAALAERLRKLLTDNENVRERCRFLEDTVKLLNEDLQKARDASRGMKKVYGGYEAAI